MTLRQIIAVALFGTAAYFGVLGVRMFQEGGDGPTKLVALIFCGWGVMGTLIAIAIAFKKGHAKEPSDESAGSAFSRFKGSVVLLCVVAMGLGMLYMAAEGVLSGAMPTLARRGRNVFLYSTNPLAFLAMLIFWVAVGAGLLWFAWAEFRRERSK